MKPIGRPGQQSARPMVELTAERCADFGKPAPDYDTGKARSAAVSLAVALPLPALRPAQPDEGVRSCRGCNNYVATPEAQPVIGWTTGYCKAKGELLLEDRLEAYAEGCDFRTRKTSPMRVIDLIQEEVMLFPEFQDGFGRLSLKVQLAKRGEDPQEYETDVPVSDVEAKSGIRAWRIIKDPDGYGPDIKLPIFARSYFSDTEQSKVPLASDEERPGDYVDHGGFIYKVGVIWMELDETPAVWGPSGTGKTELFRHMAWLMGMPFERISITPSSDIDDLAGKPAYSKERGTYFIYGRVPRSWTKPGVVCVDEPNSGPPEVWMFFRPLTDNSKQLVLDQNEGERLPRHMQCFLGMAMNPAWDPRNVGVATLADADGSRLAHIFMDLPPADVERKIIARSLEVDNWEPAKVKPAIDMLMANASELRRLSADGALPVSWGLRHQIKAARALKFFTPVSAYRIAIADSLEPEVQNTVLDIVRSRMSGE